MAGSATLGGIPASNSGGFSDVLGQMVQEVNGKQAAAGDAVQGLLSGDKVSLHQAMISMEEASVSFQLMVEVRNKLLESYQEIMRMQI
jgi:flagellar hook-basal body complex protein FliE